MATNARLSAGVKASAHMAQRGHLVHVYLYSTPDVIDIHEPTGVSTLDLELPNF